MIVGSALLNPYAHAAGFGAFVVDGADFDGTNDYMTRGAGLTGAADSKLGIFSAWIRLDAATGEFYIADTNSDCAVFRGALSEKWQINMANAAATNILLLQTSTTILAGASWRHFLASWDLGTVGARHLYVDDVSNISVVTFTNDTIDYTKTNWGIGADPAGGSKVNGCLSEFYFAPGQYLDFSVEANRRKFISATGKPVSLGATGSIPTGVAPLVYLHLDDGEAVANFATNRGTGGNFTITGTLDTASSSPSD